jgi:protein-disulfide isomerase
VAGAVSVEVFTEPDCPYCDELRSRVMPEIEKEFGTRVRINYRPATDLPAVRRTPTLILTPGRLGAQGRVIEGLPTLERLRGAIRDLETRS